MASLTRHVSTFDGTFEYIVLDLQPGSLDDQRILSHVTYEFFPRFNHNCISIEWIQEKLPVGKARFAALIGRIVCLLTQRQMFYHFKWCYGCLDTLALIIAAAGHRRWIRLGKQYPGCLFNGS